MLDGIDDLYVAKGKRVDHYDLREGGPSREELLGLLLGRSGKLRAPTLRAGTRLIVGYNSDVLSNVLL